MHGGSCGNLEWRRAHNQMTDNLRQNPANRQRTSALASSQARHAQRDADYSNAVLAATSYPEQLGPGHINRLQSLVGNQVVGRIVQRAAAGLVIQRKLEATVRQELKTGSLVANMTGNFITSHGQGVDDNVGATKIHASRKSIPLTNTVIKDLHALKDNIHDQAFTSVNNGWSVTTKEAISLVDTTKKAGAIGAKPKAPTTINATAYGGETFHYDDDGSVESVDGLALTEEELEHANLKAGAKPKSSAKAPVKNAWRAKFLEAVNAYRTKQGTDADTAWVKQYFANINGVATADQDDPNAIPEKESKVTVFIRSNTGDIYHLDGTDDEAG